MALNFPNSPTLNQVYTDTTSGFSYQWNGTVWISFSAASSNQIKVLDDISGSFTGIAFTFALTSSGTSISPPNAQSLIINLGGVIQDPSDDYIVSGSNIIFSTAPTNGLSFSGVSLGPAIPVNTIPDGTVTGGSLTVAGILSTTNLYVAGVSTFVGLATHTGTIFGSNLSLTGVATATTFVGSLTGTASTATAAATAYGLTGSPNITVGVATVTTLKVGTGVTISSGVVTATEFDISGSSNTLTAGGLNVGVATATTFVGSLTGNATGLSGSPNIIVGTVTGSAATFTDLTVNGTQTIINTTSLEITDKNIGIGSTSSPSDALADGAGLTIYGATNKTITWERDTGCFEYNQPSKFKGVIETVSTASTYDLGGGRVVLELDVRNATTYTHSLTNGTVGIVSFKNIPADTGVSNGTTITVLFTQNSAGTANTTAATGIGTNCFIVGFEDGATVAGISTRALVGSATTVTLSTTGSDRDFVSFFVHYTGGTNTVASSYQVYATKNGGFRQGTVGV